MQEILHTGYKEVNMAVSDFVTGYEHIGVPTNDMDATIEFYETLGFTRLYETDNNGKVIFFGLGDIVVETYEVHGDAAGKRGAVDHMALMVTDVDKAYEEIRKTKYPVIEGPCTLPFWANGYYYFLVQGPNCEVVEFGRKL